MFRASQHPSSAALNTVTATSGIGHNTGTATSFQRGLFRKIGSAKKKYIYIYTYITTSTSALDGGGWSKLRPGRFTPGN